jgi:hypothetical protein
MLLLQSLYIKQVINSAFPLSFPDFKYLKPKFRQRIFPSVEG